MRVTNLEFEFTRAVQPANYETTRATGKLSATVDDDESPDVNAALRDLSAKVQQHVLAAVGRYNIEPGLAYGPKDEPPTTGRPKVHAAEAAQAQPAQPAAQAQPEQPAQPAAEAQEPEITDNDLTQAAQEKAKRDGGPDGVKKIITHDFGLARARDAAGDTRRKLYEALNSA